MNECELNKLKELFSKLRELVNDYGGKAYKIQQGILENVVACIDLICQLMRKKCI